LLRETRKYNNVYKIYGIEVATSYSKERNIFYTIFYIPQELEPIKVVHSNWEVLYEKIRSEYNKYSYAPSDKLPPIEMLSNFEFGK